MRSTVNPFHQPLFEPVDRETIECDLDLLVRAQMNHFGYVGCSQVGDWSAIAGPGVLCRFREAALRERGNGRPRVLRPEVVRAAARARNCGHRGIARAGVVLSRRLAGCQSEAVPHVLTALSTP